MKNSILISYPHLWSMRCKLNLPHWITNRMFVYALSRCTKNGSRFLSQFRCENEKRNLEFVGDHLLIPEYVSATLSLILVEPLILIINSYLPNYDNIPIDVQQIEFS